uniref:MULE transposase domain-containing protein n=1 Tax=Magallana gigas TaxID=29159 RepID=A0A8W8JDP0_MAGGI
MYKDDENDFIDMMETNFKKFIRQVRSIQICDRAVVNLKVTEGSSPAGNKVGISDDRSKSKCVNVEQDPGPQARKGLDFPTLSQDSEASMFDFFEYKSPLDYSLQYIEEEMNQLGVQVQSAKERLTELTDRVRTHLINGNKNKYLIPTAEWVIPKSAAVNVDLAKLEKHFKGKVPAELEIVSTLFENIIAGYDKANAPQSPIASTSTNPAGRLLEYNSLMAVKFPRLSVEIDTLRKPLSTDADYYQVLRFIDHQLPESIALEGFIADFEVALWKALKDRFPGTPIQGCVFHWTQVVLGKSRSTDFRLPITRSTQSTSSCANSWPCHSILPPEHIEETFLRLDGRAPEVLAPVMDFVYRTWIRSSVFKIDHWSVFMTSIRMNNDVEG